MNNGNKFVVKTKDALDIDTNNEKRLAINGFEVYDDKDEECILIMGLNPAGKDEDATQDKNRAKNKLPYLYCLDNEKEIDGWTYPTYYRPILRFVNNITGSDAKWGWCNVYENMIKDKIHKNTALEKRKDEISAYYNSNKDKNYSIYIGDMFYYHETSSKEIEKLFKGKSSYYRKMLEMHIEYLEQHKKTVKLIYINSAMVSHGLCDNKVNTYDDSSFNGIPIFYGGMLSGGRAMDSFSVKRLENEINNKHIFNYKQKEKENKKNKY